MKPLNLLSTIALFLLLLTVVIFAQTTVVEHNVNFADVNNAALVGEGGLAMKTTDGGLTWETMQTGVTIVLYGNGYFDNSTMIAVGENGVILKSTDSGANWEIKTSGVTSNLYDIDVIDSLYAYACGEEGILLFTNDAGETWNQCYAQPGLNLNDVSFYDQNIGFAVGAASTVIKTTDGGVTWTELRPLIAEIFVINAIGIKTPDLLTIVGDGGNVFNSTDGGETWLPIDTQLTTENLKDIFYFTTTDGVLAGENGQLHKTVDGGESWFSVTPTEVFAAIQPNAVAFSNTSNGIIVGKDGLQMYTTDAGVTWTRTLDETAEKPKGSNIKKLGNYPNPFNPSTKLSFEMPNAGSVTVKVFDITGKEVANVFSGNVKAGIQEFVFNASSLSSGVYFYRVAANMNGNTSIQTGRMLLVK